MITLRLNVFSPVSPRGIKALCLSFCLCFSSTTQIDSRTFSTRCSTFRSFYRYLLTLLINSNSSVSSEISHTMPKLTLNPFSVAPKDKASKGKGKAKASSTSKSTGKKKPLSEKEALKAKEKAKEKNKNVDSEEAPPPYSLEDEMPSSTNHHALHPIDAYFCSGSRKRPARQAEHYPPESSRAQATSQRGFDDGYPDQGFDGGPGPVQPPFARPAPTYQDMHQPWEGEEDDGEEEEDVFSEGPAQMPPTFNRPSASRSNLAPPRRMNVPAQEYEPQEPRPPRHSATVQRTRNVASPPMRREPTFSFQEEAPSDDMAMIPFQQQAQTPYQQPTAGSMHIRQQQSIQPMPAYHGNQGQIVPYQQQRQMGPYQQQPQMMPQQGMMQQQGQIMPQGSNEGPQSAFMQAQWQEFQQKFFMWQMQKSQEDGLRDMKAEVERMHQGMQQQIKETQDKAEKDKLRADVAVLTEQIRDMKLENVKKEVVSKTKRALDKERIRGVEREAARANNRVGMSILANKAARRQQKQEQMMMMQMSEQPQMPPIHINNVVHGSRNEQHQETKAGGGGVGFVPAWGGYWGGPWRGPRYGPYW